MDAVEDIKSRLAIEDVLSEYVQLKRSGRNYKSLSPFTNEKTPSFVVSPEKQIWHDFSSGKGGDIFGFVMEVEGLDFKGALELLARKAGVDLQDYSGRSGESSKLKEELIRINELAVKFYQVQLSHNQKALEYLLKKRGFTKEVLLAFRLGYSPNNGTALTDYLKKNKISDQSIVKAGLGNRRYSAIRDMFRERIMVPLMDQQGSPIGFTARILESSDNAPKYINTPKTPVYDKSRHIFGLHLAKEAIRKSNYVVVAEGNLDVIASYQAGIKQVVATAGTAMTDYQLKTLSRFTPDVRLAFDQDSAGIAAAERVIPMAAKHDISLGIITLPSGKDPDELIKKDSGLWQKAIDDKIYALDWLIDSYKSRLDLSSASGKREYSNKILSIVKKLTDAVEQDHYVSKLAKILEVSPDALRSKLNSSQSADRKLFKHKSTENVERTAIVEYKKTQEHLLSITLHKPNLRQVIKELSPEMFISDEAKKLRDIMVTDADFNGDFDKQNDTASTDRNLQQMTDYVKILRLQFETLYQHLDDLEAAYEANRLRKRLIEYYVRTKKARIVSQLGAADEQSTQKLLEQARVLDKMLKS